jgi:hypothetical protein
MALVRYDSEGILDTSFGPSGSDGQVIADLFDGAGFGVADQRIKVEVDPGGDGPTRLDLHGAE